MPVPATSSAVLPGTDFDVGALLRQQQADTAQALGAMASVVGTIMAA